MGRMGHIGRIGTALLECTKSTVTERWSRGDGISTARGPVPPASCQPCTNNKIVSLPARQLNTLRLRNSRPRRRCLSPVAVDPDVPVAVAVVMGADPGGARVRGPFPMAALPGPASAHPSPVSANPDKAWSGGGDDYLAHGWRGWAYHHFALGHRPVHRATGRSEAERGNQQNLLNLR